MTRLLSVLFSRLSQIVEGAGTEGNGAVCGLIVRRVRSKSCCRELRPTFVLVVPRKIFVFFFLVMGPG